MEIRKDTQPESLGYLPAFFRAQVEPAGVLEHDFVRWLLQSFETNQHWAERIAAGSQMLCDPDEVTALPWKVDCPLFSVRDIADQRSFTATLGRREDEISKFLWEGFSAATQQALEVASPAKSDTTLLQDLLIEDLNGIISRGSIYDLARFRGVRFSERTRALLRQQPEGEALVFLNRFLLEDAYPLEIAARPEPWVLHSGEWEMQFLHWLASWVALDLDRDWFAQEMDGEHPEPRSTPTQVSGLRFDKVRKLIKRAAPLYRERGTSGGLEKTVKEFYDWDIQVIERSWPEGMDIGLSSRVGLSTRLVEEPDLDGQFVVLITSSTPGQSPPPELGEQIQSELVGQSHGRRVEWRLQAGPQGAGTSRAAFTTAVDRLRRLIDQEIPAHTRYYLAFETSQARPTPQPFSPLRIEVDSRIGSFWIN